MASANEHIPQTAAYPHAIASIPLRDQLHNGDRMNREEFHRRYVKYPKNVKIELIGGTVYFADTTRMAPLRDPHGVYHSEVNGWMVFYKAKTSGVIVSDNATVLLDDDAEPQPDLQLRITVPSLARARVNDDEYVEGAPELLAEIAYSSVTIDMNQKKAQYRKSGILEYLVVLIEEQEVHWFNLANDRSLASDQDGVIRSEVFPGLWLDTNALLAKDSAAMLSTLDRGLVSPEHAAFVEKLATHQ